MLRIINFLKPNNSLANAAVRNYGKHNKKYLYKDGKKFDLIHYYPRCLFFFSFYKKFS